MNGRIVDVEHVGDTVCCLCGHKNGELSYSYANGVQIEGSGKPFVQPFYVMDQGTERERWAHVGCEEQRAYDQYEHWRDMRDFTTGGCIGWDEVEERDRDRGLV